MEDTVHRSDDTSLSQAERMNKDSEHQRRVEQWLTTVQTGARVVYSADKPSLSVIIPIPLKLREIGPRRRERPEDDWTYTLFTVVVDRPGQGWGTMSYPSMVAYSGTESDGRSRYTVVENWWEHRGYLVTWTVRKELDDATANSAECFKCTHAIIDSSKELSDKGHWSLDKLHPGELWFECMPKDIEHVKGLVDKVKMNTEKSEATASTEDNTSQPF